MIAVIIDETPVSRKAELRQCVFQDCGPVRAVVRHHACRDVATATLPWSFLEKVHVVAETFESEHPLEDAGDGSRHWILDHPRFDHNSRHMPGTPMPRPRKTASGPAPSP